jgi:hypothetical protein
MSPVQNRTNGLPIPIQAQPKPVRKASATLASGYVHLPRQFWSSLTHGGKFLSSSLSLHASRLTYPILPHDLASDIQQFSESQYAKQYFSTHRTGFIFKRTVPVAQMMTWQKVSVHQSVLVIELMLIWNF